jgi:predicted DNA-binding protein with PD1-like motif
MQYQSIRVVRRDQFDSATAQTPGSQRLATIHPEAGIDSPMGDGLFCVEPAARTAIHYHGEQHTIANAQQLCLCSMGRAGRVRFHPARGALNGATLAWFDPERKMYRKIPIQGQVEVVSMIGDIALYQGKPNVHTHMVLGLPDGTTKGGHVLDAHVSPTLEVMVTVDPIAMHKRLDPETDLTLIDPAMR